MRKSQADSKKTLCCKLLIFMYLWKHSKKSLIYLRLFRMFTQVADYQRVMQKARGRFALSR